MKILFIYFYVIDNSLVVESIYSSKLTEDSSTFARKNCESSDYYYEAIEIDVIEGGCYNLISNSTIDTYGYIYKNYFYSIDSTINLVSENDRGFRSNQFELITQLQTNTKYILVVTTNDPNVTGVFSLLVTGPKNVKFNRISKYLSVWSKINEI